MYLIYIYICCKSTHKFPRLYLRESSIVINDRASPAIIARVSKTGVDFLLTLVAMVTRCALTLVVTETQCLACATMTTGVGVANVTLGQNGWICLVYKTKIYVKLNGSIFITVLAKFSTLKVNIFYT